MPELSEVKIMSDFINHVASVESFYSRIEKSPVSKVKTPLEVFDGGVFTLQAVSRGKELKLQLEMVGGDIHNPITQNFLVTLGMSGNWIYVRKDSPNLEKALKHSHLRFITTHGNYLALHDVRRFAKWKWSDDWNKGRGPCPLTEYEMFGAHIKQHWQTHKAFTGPINEVLMNQGFFNGIGNYLRAEILYRLDINPFTIAKEIPTNKMQELILLCHMCCRDSYALGGGQLKDWHNPMGTDGRSFKEWIKCYGLIDMMSITDKTKRRFWFNPKWSGQVPAIYSQK